MTRALLIAALLLSGCPPRSGETTPRPEPEPQPQPEVARVGELQLALRPRATRGLVRASLWIDAGSRDGTPPATATLAAWAAGEGLATPDATVFEARCEQNDLDACLAPLGEALATRAIDPERHAALRARLVEARRRAAADPRRRAEVLAVAAALESPAVDPLGDATDDEALTREAISDFLGAHYGIGRALLILQGDLPSDVREHVARVASGWPRAAAPRGTREAPAAGARTRTETAAQGATAIAALFDDPAAAEAAAAATAGTRLFALRGGTVVLSTGGTPDLQERTHRLATLTLAGEPPAASATGEADESDPTVAIVSRWLAAGSGGVRALGVGASCAEGRGRPELEECTRRVRAAVDAAVAAAAPERTGPVDGHSGAVRLPNGAQVRSERVPGAVGVVVRFAGGPNESPPGAHGRAAIAARALALECDRPVRPFAESTGWGLIHVGSPSELGAVVRCAMAEPDPETVARARNRVRAIARRRPARSWAARLVAPGNPGLVAPEGSDSGAASVRSIDDFLAEARVGARTVVAIVGDVDPTEATDRVAPILGALPAGEAPGSIERSPADITLRAEQQASDTPRVAVALAVDAEGRGAATAARAFARALGEAATEAGLPVHAWDGGAGEGMAWALIAFDVAEEALDGVPGRIERAIRTASVDMEAMHETLRWATGDPRRAARRLARDGTTEPPVPDRLVIEALRDAEPSYVIGRREPGLGFPSLQRRQAAETDDD